VELFDVLRNHPRLHVHLAPHAFQGDAGDSLHEDPLEAEFIVCGGTVRDDAWGGDRCMFSNVRECCHFARGLVERLHRNGNTEDIGKLGLDSIVTEGGDGV